MYRWLRNTHLLLGVFTFLFMVMYGLTGMQMSHGRWFNNKNTVTRTEVPIPSGQGGDARSVAQVLMDRKLIRGAISNIEETDGGFTIQVIRLGTRYKIDYSRATGIAAVQSSEMPGVIVLNRAHRVAGFEYAYWLTKGWAAFTVISSVALLLLGGTGLYLWFKLNNERVIGSILLGLNLVYSLSLMVFIRMA